MQQQFAQGAEVLHFDRGWRQIVHRAPIVADQAGQVEGCGRIRVGQMQRRAAQRLRLAHEENIGGFEVAVGKTARPFQPQATGNDAMNHLPQGGAVHATAPGNPSFERLARVKVGGVPNSLVAESEVMNGGKAATAFAAGLLELLDAGQKLLRGVVIEGVFRPSFRRRASLGDIIFDGERGVTQVLRFARAPDRRNVAAIFRDRERLAERFKVTKFWHCAPEERSRHLC